MSATNGDIYVHQNGDSNYHAKEIFVKTISSQTSHKKTTTYVNGETVVEETNTDSKNTFVSNDKDNNVAANGVIANGCVKNHANRVVTSTAVPSSAAPSPNAFPSRREYVDFMKNMKYVDPSTPSHQKGPDYIIETDAICTSRPDGATKLCTTDLDIIPVTSVVTNLKNAAEDSPDTVAYAVKRDNDTEWTKTTYAEYLKLTRTAAKAFMKLGLLPLRSVSILGFNSPEWFLADLGAIFAGGIATGIYTTNKPDACLHILSDSLSQIVVVENEKQLEKILEIRDRLPEIKAIVQYTGKPSRQDVLAWSELMEIGETVSDEALERRIKGISANQCCTLVYTSGTTGNPKGVMYSHDNFFYSSKLILEVVPLKYPVSLSYLPLNHSAAQLLDIHGAIACRGSVYIARPDALKGSLKDTLKEVKPTFMFGVPRVWEKMYDGIKAHEQTLGFVASKLLGFAKSVMLREMKLRESGSNALPYGYGFANAILKKIHKAIGFENCGTFGTGSAPIDPEVLKYFYSIGIFIQEGYGMSEIGVSHSTTFKNRQFGSIGLPILGVEFKLTDVGPSGEGEICVRGRSRFLGYFRAEEKTKETIDEEGWCHSGDLGRLDEKGYLYITGRIKELLITAGGENVPPIYIEENIKRELPCLSRAVVIGDKKKFLSALLTISTEMDINTGLPLPTLSGVARNWCKSIGIEATTVDQLFNGSYQVIKEAVQKGIDRANKNAISNAQTVQKFRILPCDFSIPGGEIGPTLKLMRHVVLGKYKDIIDEIYA